MKLFDITQNVFSCKVYPGDPKPERKRLCLMENGDSYNLTAFSMCAHNGTHIDAPFHFISGGKTVEEIPLSKTVGYAYVAEASGEIDGEAAGNILKKAAECLNDSQRRILIKGEATVTYEAAEVFSRNGIYLIGNESQTVGPENSPVEVHKLLLNKEIVLLEGIRLTEVSEGAYFLFAAPLLLEGADGAPVRAILMEIQQ